MFNHVGSFVGATEPDPDPSEEEAVEPPRPRPRRIVLKIGSRLLLAEGGALDPERIRRFASVIADHLATETVIVSSGAVAAGYRRLGMTRPPTGTTVRQAAAAVGQTWLMRTWARCFQDRGREVGQILLTNDVVLDRKRYLNARNAFESLFGAGVVPVVNENDTVSTDEIRVGDNDNLAAYTAALVRADLLVLLTDVPGVFDQDPRRVSGARPVPQAASAEDLRRYCFRKGFPESVGGMATKLDAADRAGSFGIPTVITSGFDPEALPAIFESRPTGTRIEGWKEPLPARRQWMLMQARVHGEIVVDDGAVEALTNGGASLLPCGILKISGRFRAGDVVSIVDSRGVQKARGIVAFEDHELERIRGRQSTEIEDLLGYRTGDAVVRAEKMVLVPGTDGGR